MESPARARHPRRSLPGQKEDLSFPNEFRNGALARACHGAEGGAPVVFAEGASTALAHRSAHERSPPIRTFRSTRSRWLPLARTSCRIFLGRPVCHRTRRPSLGILRGILVPAPARSHLLRPDRRRWHVPFPHALPRQRPASLLLPARVPRRQRVVHDSGGSRFEYRRSVSLRGLPHPMDAPGHFASRTLR